MGCLCCCFRGKNKLSKSTLNQDVEMNLITQQLLANTNSKNKKQRKSKKNKNQSNNATNYLQQAQNNVQNMDALPLMTQNNTTTCQPTANTGLAPSFQPAQGSHPLHQLQQAQTTAPTGQEILTTPFSTGLSPAPFKKSNSLVPGHIQLEANDSRAGQHTPAGTQNPLGPYRHMLVQPDGGAPFHGHLNKTSFGDSSKSGEGGGTESNENNTNATPKHQPEAGKVADNKMSIDSSMSYDISNQIRQMRKVQSYNQRRKNSIISNSSSKRVSSKVFNLKSKQFPGVEQTYKRTISQADSEEFFDFQNEQD